MRWYAEFLQFKYVAKFRIAIMYASADVSRIRSYPDRSTMWAKFFHEYTTWGHNKPFRYCKIFCYKQPDALVEDGTIFYLKRLLMSFEIGVSVE